MGFLVGAVIGISGRNCSHPAQPPFLECITEDPQDPFIPAVALALLAVVIVAAVDLTRTALKSRSRVRVLPWRRWLYVGLLVAVAFPAARIAVEQAGGGCSDSDAMLISVVGTWVLTPLIWSMNWRLSPPCSRSWILLTSHSRPSRFDVRLCSEKSAFGSGHPTHRKDLRLCP